MDRLKNKEFYSTLIKLAIPIAFQNLIASSLNMVDVIMVGQLGETAIAGVGIANQIFFLLNLLVFGTFSGACIFSSQYWGKQDAAGVRKSLSISLKIGVAISLIFTLTCLLFPHYMIGIFTDDPAVVELGAEFLVINSLSFIIFTISFGYSIISRSIGGVKLPMLASIVALSLNTLLNFLLIEGNWGFPRMGVRGAGLSTVISRAVEFIIIISAIYGCKSPIAVSIGELLSFDAAFFIKFIKTTMPVIVHEGLWSLGTTAYTFIYAHMGTDIIAAMNIALNVDKLAMVLFFGICNASAIIVGQKIGEGACEQAHKDSAKLLIIAPILGIAIGTALIASFGLILSFFDVSAEVKASAAQILTIIAVLLPIRAVNLTIIIGISRAGGDTRFSLLVEVIPMWLIAIPLVFFGGLHLRLPLVYVYILSYTEEVIKMVLGLKRYFSKKWIHNVTHILK